MEADDTRTEEAKRLAKARRDRGFADAKAASDYFGWNYTTYQPARARRTRAEEGRCGEVRASLPYPLAWLTYGTGSEVEAAPSVAIVGKIGANAQPDAIAFAHEGEGYAFDYSAPVPPNFSEGTRALEVEGDSMRNIARDGWLIYYDDDEVQEPPQDGLFGELCICWLEDGRVLFKELQPGMGDGFFDLESTNASDDPRRRGAQGRSRDRDPAARPPAEHGQAFTWSRHQRKTTGVIGSSWLIACSAPLRDQDDGQ